MNKKVEYKTKSLFNVIFFFFRCPYEAIALGHSSGVAYYKIGLNMNRQSTFT